MPVVPNLRNMKIRLSCCIYDIVHVCIDMCVMCIDGDMIGLDHQVCKQLPSISKVSNFSAVSCVNVYFASFNLMHYVYPPCMILSYISVFGCTWC